MGKKNIGGAVLDDLKALPKKILKPYYKNGKLNANKIAINGIPFVIIFYVINKYVQAAVSADGGDMLDKCVKAFSLIFQVKPYFAPSFKLTPLICGIGAGVAFKLFMNSRKKNAKQFRPREEYGSAKWGTDKDFEPYTDPVKWNNIPLTATEWLRMTRPEHPKYDRNKNILIVGGSGAGKTRGFVKPSLMQMQCSYVVTDPKGTVLEEVGTMLARGAWELDDKGNKVPKVGKNGQVLKTKSGKVIYKRTPYKIKVFNTINFAKSMHYNPFAYIHTEQSKAQLKSIYKDNAETIEGNCDTFLFLGGKEKSTLKDLSEVLGKETIDTYNTSDTRGTSQSYGLNYQKLGRELMSQDRLALMDGGKCILQVRGVRPFFSDKVDITAHEMYKELSDFDKKNQFDIEKYVSEYGKPKFSKKDKFIELDLTGVKYPDNLVNFAIEEAGMMKKAEQNEAAALQ